MLRGCVGFSWAKPSVTKSSTHPLVFLVLKISVPSAYSEDMRPSTKCWEKNLHSKVFHSAELRDGKRPRVSRCPSGPGAFWLALNPHWQCQPAALPLTLRRSQPLWPVRARVWGHGHERLPHSHPCTTHAHQIVARRHPPEGVAHR